MPRPLTTTIALVLVLAVAGCGKDDTSDTTARSAATATPASDAAAAGNKAGSSTRGTKKSPGSKTSSGSKSSGSKSAGSKSSGSKSSGSKSSGSKKKSSASKSSGSKTSAGSKKAAGSNSPATAAGGSPSGDGAADPRVAVVATVRRYQKDFVDGDGDDACLLLTAAGKKQMNAGGRGRTCAESVKRILDQARDSDIELIKDTRAGIHVDDVKIRGDDATVSIGKGQRLRLVRQGGRWLVDDPSP
jgi:hypothetical protein